MLFLCLLILEIRIVNVQFYTLRVILIWFMKVLSLYMYNCVFKEDGIILISDINARSFPLFQLLKALFGTNLICQWEPQHLQNLSGKPGKAARLTGNNKPGQYYFCFTQPYTQFTQSLAGATFKASSHTEQEESSGWGYWEYFGNWFM